jgi:hypothetical protein
MKLTIIALFSLLSLSAFASDSCVRTCNSDANQMGLMCQKMRQNCMRIGSPESTQFEMCMDDVSACLQTGKAIFESCLTACELEESN